MEADTQDRKGSCETRMFTNLVTTLLCAPSPLNQPHHATTELEEAPAHRRRPIEPGGDCTVQPESAKSAKGLVVAQRLRTLNRTRRRYLMACQKRAAVPMHRHGRLRTLNEVSASVAQETCQVAGREVEDRGGIAELRVPDVEAVAIGAGSKLNTI